MSRLHAHLRLAIAAVWVLFIPAAAGAQILTTWCVSTPFSPPRGYLWVPPLYLAALFLWLRFATRRWGDGRGVAIPIVVLIVMASVAAFAAGALLVALELVSPPGFGFPSAPFHGIGWDRMGGQFFSGNLLAGLFLLVSVGIVLGKMGVRDLRWGGLTVAGCAAIYLLCLTPYVVSRGIIHGRPGAVTHSQCQDHLRHLSFALDSYAEAHDWRLPPVDSLEELAHQREGGLTIHCPVELLLSSDPEPYRWNADLAGRSLLELAEECPDAMVVWCPRDHGGVQYGIRVCDLMAAIEIEDGRVRLRPLFR